LGTGEKQSRIADEKSTLIGQTNCPGDHAEVKISRQTAGKKISGLAWLGLAWLGLAWLGLAWLGRIMMLVVVMSSRLSGFFPLMAPFVQKG